MQKKVIALCLRVQFFWPTLYNGHLQIRFSVTADCYLRYIVIDSYLDDVNKFF